MPRYLHILEVLDEELGETICTVEAYSKESIDEQYHKVDNAIADYKKVSEEEY